MAEHRVSRSNAADLLGLAVSHCGPFFFRYSFRIPEYWSYVQWGVRYRPPTTEQRGPCSSTILALAKGYIHIQFYSPGHARIFYKLSVFYEVRTCICCQRRILLAHQCVIDSHPSSSFCFSQIRAKRQSPPYVPPVHLAPWLRIRPGWWALTQRRNALSDWAPPCSHGCIAFPSVADRERSMVFKSRVSISNEERGHVRKLEAAMKELRREPSSVIKTLFH